MSASHACLFCSAPISSMGARCDACGKQSDLRRPIGQHVKIGASALLCIASLVLAIALNEVWICLPALVGYYLWVLAIVEAPAQEPGRLQQRVDRAQELRHHRIMAGLLIVMSLPLSGSQTWSDWNWHWTATYAAAWLWSWVAPLLRRKSGPSS